jgi:hypothetical protein
VTYAWLDQWLYILPRVITEISKGKTILWTWVQAQILYGHLLFNPIWGDTSALFIWSFGMTRLWIRQIISCIMRGSCTTRHTQVTIVILIMIHLSMLPLLAEGLPSMVETQELQPLIIPAWKTRDKINLAISLIGL